MTGLRDTASGHPATLLDPLSEADVLHELAFAMVEGHEERAYRYIDQGRLALGLSHLRTAAGWLALAGRLLIGPEVYRGSLLSTEETIPANVSGQTAGRDTSCKSTLFRASEAIVEGDERGSTKRGRR